MAARGQPVRWEVYVGGRGSDSAVISQSNTEILGACVSHLSWGTNSLTEQAY